MISSLAALSARFSAALLGQKSQDAGIEQKAPLLAHYSAVLQAQLLPTMEIIDVSIIEVLVRVVVSTQDSEAAIHSAITTMVSPTGAEFRQAIWKQQVFQKQTIIRKKQIYPKRVLRPPKKVTFTKAPSRSLYFLTNNYSSCQSYHPCKLQNLHMICGILEPEPLT